uniref:Carboxypeptidase B1 n=1 Tax=Aquila chrysaetos chrysaetos TaxID=223781 RepID=A0A663E128_AQUCH
RLILLASKIGSVDFWQPHSVTLSFEVADLLKESGAEYRVLIDNLQAALDAQFDRKAHTIRHSCEKYNSWEMVKTQTLSCSVTGETYEGWPMYLLKMGKSSPNKKAIFMDCGFHAGEWMSPAFYQWFVKEVTVETYGEDTTNVSTFFFLKKSIKETISHCTGTDPNRNFNADWCTLGASKNPCDSTYCSSAPESGRETKALAYLTIHSYSQKLLKICIYPFSYRIARAASKQLASLYNTKYTYGPGARTIYPAAGGSDDWAYDQGIKYSFTFELRDTGRYGFILPETQIKPTCEETLLAVKYIANYVLEHLY